MICSTGDLTDGGVPGEEAAGREGRRADSIGLGLAVGRVREDLRTTGAEWELVGVPARVVGGDVRTVELPGGREGLRESTGREAGRDAIPSRWYFCEEVVGLPAGFLCCWWCFGDPTLGELGRDLVYGGITCGKEDMAGEEEDEGKDVIVCLRPGNASVDVITGVSAGLVCVVDVTVCTWVFIVTGEN